MLARVLAFACLACFGGCSRSLGGGAADGSGGGSPDAPGDSASTQNCSSLQRSLTEVPDDGATGSCALALGPPPSSLVSNNCIKIFIGGLAVPHDTTQADGWDYANADHTIIALYGAACTAAQAAGPPPVTVLYYCCGVA
jgi:hypothetical protein